MTCRLPNINHYGLTGCYIAGGAVLSTVTKTDIKDYDVYPKSKEDTLNVCAVLFDAGGFVINMSVNAITFKLNDKNSNGERVIVQVILGQYPTPSAIFDAFDFTICMGAFDCDTGEYHMVEDFWIDVASKTIRFNVDTKWPLNSLIRVYKYTKKGYYTGKTEMAKIALAIARDGMPNSWEELEDAIGGVYGRSLKLSRTEEKKTECILDDLVDTVSLKDEEPLEFNFDNAIEMLSKITEENFEGYLEDVAHIYTNTGIDELEIILSDEALELYTITNPSQQTTYVKILDGWVHPVKNGKTLVDNHVDSGKIVVKPLKDRGGFIWGTKHLKKKGDEFVGGVHNGNHNGVTYSYGNTTAYDKHPFLFCYVDENQHINKGDYKCKVAVSVSDIVSIDTYKINTKSMLCMDVTEVE